MQDIEREAFDMQLQDKLLAYKRDMGLLGAGAGSAAPQALPAEGETTATGGQERHWRKPPCRLIIVICVIESQ